MKKIVSILLIYSFVLSASHLSAQIMKVYDNTYSYKRDVYEFQDMEDVFISDFDSYTMYKYALKARKNTRMYGYISLGVILVCTLAVNVGDDGRCRGILCPSTANDIAVTGYFVVLPITAIIGLVTRINYCSRKRKAIKLFNATGDLGQIYIPATWSANFGSAPHGLGFTINF